MTQYASVEEGQVIRLGSRPNWRYDSGEPVTDETLVEHGRLPVIYEQPEHDPVSQRVSLQPKENWAIEPARVIATYMVTAIPFDELKSTALMRINADYSIRTAAISAGYPEDEQKSWPIQIEEANALLADESATTPWIDRAAARRGLTRIELAQRIKAKDMAYREVHGDLTGIRQDLEDAINAVPDDEHAAAAFAAIQWPPDQATDPT